MQFERVLLDSATQRSLEHWSEQRCVDGKGRPGALGTGSLLVLVYVKGREDLFWLMAKVSMVLGKGSGRSGHEEQSGVPHTFHAILSFQF